MDRTPPPPPLHIILNFFIVFILPQLSALGFPRRDAFVINLVILLFSCRAKLFLPRPRSGNISCEGGFVVLGSGRTKRELAFFSFLSFFLSLLFFSFFSFIFFSSSSTSLFQFFFLSFHLSPVSSLYFSALYEHYRLFCTQH